ncbi:protein FAR-RED IMPAIRED RESPONSE 1-like [Arachis ipaensis]|uniref:protein FAR-RED IMPAIRED RESPONSE 1-like n=1 Tax=Arachis ipaensis TaxID=130454 RepID=UPI0007AF52DB|nr:protein FAR-RED IMPAIRED RESPONSE 1-like [Arachis ipaensis]
MGVDEFETEWAGASAKYGLNDTLWGNQVYGKREMWANTYLRDMFCAGFRTTSRCEGINSVVKKFLQSKHTMLELVQNLELLLREFRNNELLSQFRSIYGDPVLTTSLDSLERFATRVYTRTVFNDVKKELEAVASVNFVGVRRSLTTKVYTVDEFGHPGRPIVVLCHKNMGRL